MAAADMDIDMDIDLGPIEMVEDMQPSMDLAIQGNGTEAAKDIQLDLGAPGNETPHKVHIRGVDNLTTDDIKNFSMEHFPDGPPLRIEWIDDTSANLVYSSPGEGFKALDHLSLPTSSTPQPLELRPAKNLSTHSESVLHIRTALTSDQKKPRAHEASRFYMMHPEHDPREQRRRNFSQNSDGNYRRRRYGDDENRRRRRRDQEEGFDASMYDDNNRQSSDERSPASSPNGRSHRAVNSYRPRRQGESETRNRSASPRGEGPIRRRRTPPPPYQSRDPHPFPSDNDGKELFPIKSRQSNGKIGKDLFSNKLQAAELKKELFPQKVNTILHRRSDAFDAADETADLFAHRMSVPFADDGHRGPAKSLASRITAPSESTYGRLRESDPGPEMETVEKDDDPGLNIRGASHQDQGFSIRGSAAGTIKELFPGRNVGNIGKELFAEKLEGRGMRRTRAEDMFY